MSIVTLRLPDVKRKTSIHPTECRYCHGKTFQRWGAVTKPMKYNRHRTAMIYRYRCCHCRRTFRYYPEGIDRADQTQRLRKLATLFWVLGMSLRGIPLALSAFNVQISHMTVWRDLQEQADLLRKRRHWQKVRVLGLDGVYPLINGKKQPTLIAVDLGNGQPVEIGQVDEANPQAVRRFLEPLVKQLVARRKTLVAQHLVACLSLRFLGKKRISGPLDPIRGQLAEKGGSFGWFIQFCPGGCQKLT